MPSSAKHQREMTKFCVVWRTRITITIFFMAIWNLTLSLPIFPKHVFGAIGYRTNLDSSKFLMWHRPRRRLHRCVSSLTLEVVNMYFFFVTHFIFSYFYNVKYFFVVGFFPPIVSSLRTEVYYRWLLLSRLWIKDYYVTVQLKASWWFTRWFQLLSLWMKP